MERSLLSTISLRPPKIGAFKDLVARIFVGRSAVRVCKLGSTLPGGIEARA